MTEETSFHMSQGYDVVPPKPGKAYPILCDEWKYLKGQIESIKTSFGLYHTVGSLLLGAALSTLITIFAGSFDTTNGGSEKVVAWAVVITTAAIGSVCLYFASESRAVSEKKATEVITQMNLIEQRYEQGN
jgi:hypothetical protein